MIKAQKTVARPYRNWEDLELMIKLLQAGRLASGVGQNLYLHPGDLYWRIKPMAGFDPQKYIRLWETVDGQLVAFGWYYAHETAVDIQIHPSWLNTSLLDEILDWGERTARHILPERGQGKTFIAGCFGHDERRKARLLHHNFYQDSFHYVHFSRSLEGDIPPPTLPEGYTVRGLDGSQRDIAARVATHRRAFAPSKLSEAVYNSVVQSPGYEPELDVLALGLDGSVGAFALCWVDPVTQVGLFEPVGTHPEQRRKGLAQAVLLEGLRRMQTRGMTSAVVYTEGSNYPALKLYPTVGFRVTGRDYDYCKTL